MLPQANRMRLSRDFSRVYHRGQKAVSNHLVLRVFLHHSPAGPADEPVLPTAPSQGEIPSPPRIGITVSQKVSKRAVVRNRLKRRVRAAMRTLLPRLQPGVWVVINLRPGSAECEYGEILRELEQLLTKLEVIHGHS